MERDRVWKLDETVTHCGASGRDNKGGKVFKQLLVHFPDCKDFGVFHLLFVNFFQKNNKNMKIDL